jgi:Flp pilus assembly pilin Flp
MEIEFFQVILDIVSLILGFITVYLIAAMGGIIKKGLKWISTGIVILAIFHLVETISDILGLGHEENELIHRILAVISFVMILSGFWKINRVFQEIKK